MGRTYAGILGPLAFGVTVARGIVDRDDVEATLITAVIALFAFAAIGYMIGFIAERTVVEAIEARFHAQLKAPETAGQGDGQRATRPENEAEKQA
jgi:hypothetical protein